MKAHSGWQKLLGLPVEYADRRLCLRPQRIPGQVPPCEEDRPEPGDRRRITLPKLSFLER